MKRQFNRELLEEYCSENDIKYDTILEDIKITRNTKIRGKCISENCVNDFEKTFCMMIERSGGYCKACTLIKSNQKIRNTCMEKYGVEYPLLNKKIKQIIKINIA